MKQEKIYGLLGRKLGHSWSAPIHRALGCESYRLIELEPEQLGEFLSQEHIGGLNVTIPYKRDVMPYCDIIHPTALEIGSVNTIVRKNDGKLYGYNTDIDGFLYMLRRARIKLAGKHVAILGSGGASLTVQAAARMEKAREITVISRTGPVQYDYLEHAQDIEVLINTTPVGMWPNLDDLCLNTKILSGLTRLESAVDVIYNPGRTRFLLEVEKLNPEIRRTGGLSMLVAQAKRAEELFFDREIPDHETEQIYAQLWQDQTNLVLIGMPGCGKSTIGAELAKLSGRPLIELDAEIVRKAGKSIPEIFRDDGENVFRDLESQVLQEAVLKSGQIIATGGGAVLRPENRRALRQTGQVYFLRRNLDVLPTDGRPLSQTGDLQQMYQERLPMYQVASDTSIENQGASPAEVAAEVWRDFCAYSGS